MQHHLPGSSSIAWCSWWMCGCHLWELCQNCDPDIASTLLEAGTQRRENGPLKPCAVGGVIDHMYHVQRLETRRGSWKKSWALFGTYAQLTCTSQVLGEWWRSERPSHCVPSIWVMGQSWILCRWRWTPGTGGHGYLGSSLGIQEHHEIQVAGCLISEGLL